MAPTERQRKALRIQQLAGKTPKASVQRYLKSTEPQLKEGRKSVLLLKGIKASAAMTTVLQEIRALQAPAAKLLTKKNQITAFDHTGEQSLEFLALKNDCALICMASHNKKRPNNLLLARTFDGQMLDMAELGIARFKSAKDYGGSVPKKRIGSKPLLLFVGDLWQLEPNYRHLQNLLTDFYRGDVVDKLVVTGLDHLMVFTIAQQADRVWIHQRTYYCKLKKNPVASKTPVPFLQACGPDLDFYVRRTRWADPDLYKAARVQPLGANKNKKKKNQSTNLFGETIGRLHLEKQDLAKMGGRKSKALRRAEKAAADQERAALQEELDREGQEMGLEFEQTFGFDETQIESSRNE